VNVRNNRGELLRDLILAVMGAFLVRFAYHLAIGRVIDMADAIHYINMARQFAGGDYLSFDDNLPVLYPALGSLAHFVFSDWEWAFWSVSMIASSLVVVPVYLIARDLHGPTTARIAAFMICCWPWLVDYAGRIVPESLAVLLWFTSIWLLNQGIERGGKALAIAPLAFFALHLARPEGTFIMLAAPFCALVLCAKRTGPYYRRLAIFAGACIALLAFYAITMYFAIGSATVSYRAPMIGQDLISHFRAGALDFAKTFVRLLFDVLPVMLGPLLMVFLGVGLFRPTERTRNYRFEILIFLFCGIQWAITLANFSPAPRYLMTVIIALSIWSARGMDLLSQQAAQSPRPWLRTVPIALVMATMGLGMAVSLAPEYVGSLPKMPREYKIAGRWMEENLERGLVITRKPQVGYYADMPTLGPNSTATQEDIVAIALQQGARYLVVDERYSAQLVPGLWPLLDPVNASANLKLLKADLSPFANAQVTIYQFVPPGIQYLSEAEFPQMDSSASPYQRRRTKPRGAE